jgi:hypothetical protein
MANFSAAQKREHAVLNKIQNELAFMADRQTMTVASSPVSSVPLIFNLDAFELTDGNIDFTPGNLHAPADIVNHGASTPAQKHESDGAGPDSLEWFSALLQNAAARAS